MRERTVKYYSYRKPKTGIFYCSPISNTTGKKLYTISTGTKDYIEAKKIMDSWATQDAFPIPYKKETLKSVTQLDIMASVSSMAIKKQFEAEDVFTIINVLVNTYKHEIKKDIKSFLKIIFTQLKIDVDAEKLIQENTKKKNKSIKFVDFLLNYWDHNNSAYIKDLISMGIPISEIPKKNGFINKGRTLKKHIDWFDSNLLLEDITAETINKFFSYLLLESKISESYIHQFSATIMQPLHYAERKQLIHNNVTANITRYKPKPKKKEILTQQECNKIFSSINNFKDIRHYCVNRMALETASRIGEILALKIEDIKLSNSSKGKEECWININKSYNDRIHITDSTKTKVSKTVTISAGLLTLLKQLIKQNPYKNIVDSPFLFFHSSFSDRPISYNEIASGFKQVIKNMGFYRPNLTFHSYRHLAVVLLSDSKVSAREIMQITGHKTEKMVNMYADHETETQKETKRELASKISQYLDN